jgi:hypothetical protein
VFFNFCDNKTYSQIHQFLQNSPKKKNQNIPFINVKKTSQKSFSSIKDKKKKKASGLVIKENICKNLKSISSISSNQLPLEDTQQFLIPGSKNKKLSFQKPLKNRSSLQLSIDPDNLEKLTKRSKTEEVPGQGIASLEQINVEKRLSNNQKTESFNIFHSNVGISRSSIFNSDGKRERLGLMGRSF